MFKLNFEITAGSGAELQHALAQLAQAIGGERVQAIAIRDEDKPSATMTVEAGEPKATRARANKKATDSIEVEAPQVEQEKAPETPAALSTVSDLAPEKARAEAIKVLQDHFSKNPNSMGAIKQLQTKYGVQLFTEIKDEQALDFLTDAKLVQAGTFG